MRIGQICTFFPVTSPTDMGYWMGITTSQIFSSEWRGMDSPPVLNETTEQLEGRIAYEVEVKRPCE